MGTADPRTRTVSPDLDGPPRDAAGERNDIFGRTATPVPPRLAD